MVERGLTSGFVYLIFRSPFATTDLRYPSFLRDSVHRETAARHRTGLWIRPQQAAGGSEGDPRREAGAAIETLRRRSPDTRHPAARFATARLPDGRHRPIPTTRSAPPCAASTTSAAIRLRAISTSARSSTASKARTRSPPRRPERREIPWQRAGDQSPRRLLRHKGWRADQVDLPQLSASQNASIIAPAEIEIE